MYVSCSCLACDSADYPTLESTLTKLKSLGFGACDLVLFENWQGTYPSQLAAVGQAAIDEIAQTVAASGLRVSSLNCGPSRKLGDADAVSFEQYKREFTALLALAEALGCPNITLQPGSLREGVAVDEQISVTQYQLHQLAEIRGDSEVTVSLEGHANTLIEKPTEAAAVLKGVWPEVGYTYDPSHPELQGVPLAETEGLLDYTYHVHVRNASLGEMQDTMDAGTVDFAWVVSALGKRGYDGALSIEYFSRFDPEFTSVLALRDHLVTLGVDALPS